MRMRLYSALIGFGLPLIAISGSADARLDRPEGLSPHPYGSVARNRDRADVSRKAVRYAHGKRSQRYAKGNKRQRFASRGGATSRTCLSTAARSLLGRIESNFGPVQIVSTCRPGAVIAGSGKPSRHRHGNAIDFNAGGRKAAIVGWLSRNHSAGGTMTYRGMSHIHVDIGPRFVKLNAGGRKA